MSLKKVLVAINAKYIHSNLAVYSLKSYCESEPYNVKNVHILEYTINNRVEEIIDDIYCSKPDMLAFSCYIWNIEYMCKIIVEINKLLPYCHIWLGGPEVSYNTDYYLDKYPFIQGIMVGEGEETFSELARLYDECEEAWDICTRPITKNFIMEGIVTPQKRVVVHREPVDMSSIPFPYKELSVFENRIIYYESSRGCPYSCSYCLSCIDKKLRFRDMKLVEAELDFFIENRVKQVKFIDRTFNCNRERAVAIWKYIVDKDNGITNFHFEISSDLLDDEQIEVLRSMRPGLVQLEIGVQSTNETTLSAIRRKMDIDRLKSMVARLIERGNIHIHLDLIAGLPYENLASFKRSFNDVYGMKPDELQLGFLKVLYGAYMYEDVRKYGIVYASFPPYEVLYTQWLSYDDILELKSVEEVLEIYFGSGQFVYSIRYLESFFDTPYDFYKELGRFYAQRHVFGSKHSRLERYSLLLDFVENYGYTERHINDKDIGQPEDLQVITGIDKEVLKELMTLDIYLRENSKSRPIFSRSMEEFKEQIKEIARLHNISKSEHIEIFSKETVLYAREVFGDIEPDINNYVRFDYDNRNPVTHSANVYILKKY